MRKKIDFDKYNDFINRAFSIIEASNFSDDINDKVSSLYRDYLSDDFATYELSTEEFCTYEDYCYLSQMATVLVSYIVSVPELYKKLFRDDTLTPSDFLNVVYFYEMMSVCKGSYIKLIDLFTNAYKGLSLEKLAQSVDEEELADLDDISEVDFYDSINKFGTRSATLIIDQVQASRETKNSLKNSVLDDDEDTFFKICRQNDVDFKRAGWIAKVWYSFNAIGTLLKALQSNNTFPEEEYSNIIGDKNLYSDEKSSEMAYDILSVATSDNEDAPFCMDFYELYREIGIVEGYMVAMYKKMKSLSTSVTAMKELGDYIMSEYNHLYNVVTIDNYDTCRYRICKPLDMFRDMFLTQLQLPLNSGKKKDKREFYEANRNQDQQSCIEIYKVLVKNDLLSYDEDTFYSFIYRMSFDYQGDKEPTQIEWKGKACELYQLIWWFSGDGADTRLWSKNAMFFYLSNGEPIKTNGVKNQAIAPTKRMEAVFKALKK